MPLNMTIKDLDWSGSSWVYPTARAEFGNCHRLRHLPPKVLFPPGLQHCHLLLLLQHLQIGGGAARQAAGRCTKPVAHCQGLARGSCPPPGPGPDSALSSRCSLHSLAAAAAFAWWSCLQRGLNQKLESNL